MAWCRICDKPLSEPVLLHSLTYICGTKGRWVNDSFMVCFSQDCFVRLHFISFKPNWQEYNWVMYKFHNKILPHNIKQVILYPVHAFITLLYLCSTILSQISVTRQVLPNIKKRNLGYTFSVHTIIYEAITTSLIIFYYTQCVSVNGTRCCRYHNSLTHSDRVTHICVGKLTIIGSDNGLSPGRRQAIVWTNAGILLIGPLGTNFSEILSEIQSFSFKKIHLKMSSAK